MNTHSCDYLGGTISIGVNAPNNWSVHGLNDFYKNPNDIQWGGKLCRVLFHESIHFWQFFSSGYLANLLADDWARIQRFEKEKIIVPATDYANNHFKKANHYPFSAAELTECWARYWDVHTRNPREILKEDETLTCEPEIKKLLNSSLNEGFNPGYTMQLFDTLMSKGKDCKNYAAPYRWMLNYSTSGSRFVNTVFPALMHGAFGSPNPVQLFCEAFYLLEQSKNLKKEILDNTNSNIHFNWFYMWHVVIKVIKNAISKLKLPNYTSGLQVIQIGPLKTHPIYQVYLTRVQKMFMALQLFSFEAKSTGKIDNSEEYSLKHVDFMERDIFNKFRWIAFGLPGQPNYRGFLGHYIPPPCVHFLNMDYYAHETPQLYYSDNKHEEFNNDEELKNIINSLNERIRKYKNAKKANELGLTFDIFD